MAMCFTMKAWKAINDFAITSRIWTDTFFCLKKSKKPSMALEMPKQSFRFITTPYLNLLFRERFWMGWQLVAKREVTSSTAYRCIQVFDFLFVIFVVLDDTRSLSAWNRRVPILLDNPAILCNKWYLQFWTTPYLMCHSHQRNYSN
jgi:hypothetical protein